MELTMDYCLESQITNICKVRPRRN